MPRRAPFFLLRHVSRSLLTPTRIISDIARIRNVGIIAHIDAGKTTVTERMLYLAGTTKTVGDVDDGNTITDFMDLERERGITIQSAAVTTFWGNHKINIIDTPGHVDFTLEVERCLRVLDGAAVVLDASAGVQAQTMTVWKQASRYQLPCVFFINKLDKPAANFESSLTSIEDRLHQRVAAVVVPVFEENQLVGLVDLFAAQHLILTPSSSSKPAWRSIPASSRYEEALAAGREELYSRIAEVDDNFASQLLGSSPNDIAPDAAKEVLRRAALKRSLAPVGCGTALRNDLSVQPILDMIVDYLPSPLEKKYKLPDADACGLVFKIMHDKRRGQLSFLRIYRGEFRANASVHNLNRQTVESGIKLFTPFSDDLEPVAAATEGNIVVASGLKETITGDTLVVGQHRKSSPVPQKKSNDVSQESEMVLDVMEGIDPPDPVFFCAVEPPSTGSIHAFEEALEKLIIEDPSIRVRIDRETGQTILEGMGELHIEVVKERLKREYGLNVFMGPLQVGYREVIHEPVTTSSTVDDAFGTEQKSKQSCTLTMELEPTRKAHRFNKVITRLSAEYSTTSFVRPEWLKAINEGCRNALYNGPVLGCPVHNVAVTLTGLAASGGRINPALLSACASECVTKGLRQAGASLLEPIMYLEVTLLAAADQGLHSVLHELNRRRSTVKGINHHDAQGQCVTVEAFLPLAETPGMAGAIRSLTSGMASLHMQFHEYQAVNSHDQALIVEEHSR